MMRRTLVQMLILAAIAAGPALISGLVQVKKKEEPLAQDEVRPATARTWGDKVLYVDARPRQRYDAGHIRGAILLNEEQWDSLFPLFSDAFDPDKTIVVYCDGGGCEASHEVAA